jgi:dihydropyrimidinase
LSENQFVEKTSSRAAQIFNMYPRKGIIRVGADADVVVWDPDFKKIIKATNHHHKVDFNIFEGQEVFGRADYSFSNGNLVWNGKTFLNQQKGKYIKRHPFGFVYGRHKAWTETNDPINLKVDRSTPAQSESKATSTQEQVKIEQLQAELKRVREERDQLLSKVQK